MKLFSGHSYCMKKERTLEAEKNGGREPEFKLLICATTKKLRWKQRLQKWH